MPTRRSALGLLAALPAALAAAPALAQPIRKPPRLKAGDTVALVEPAGITGDRFDLDTIEAAVRAMGLVPRRAANLLKREGYLAGTDAERAAAFNAAYADPAVRAVFAVRGGWGSARILPLIDWAMIRRAPKLLVGFSDITALHLGFAARAGVATIHGPNAASDWGRQSWESFRALAFEGATPTIANPPPPADRLAPRSHRVIRGGRATGRLLGGNLTVLTSLVGTAYMPSFDGAILCIEDIGEAQYRIDRMLTQLALAGVLGRLAGAVFGQCTDCTTSGPGFGMFTLSQLLEHHLGALGVPVFEGLMFGHIAEQLSLPLGVRAELDADTGTVRVLEAVVG